MYIQILSICCYNSVQLASWDLLNVNLNPIDLISPVCYMCKHREKTLDHLYSTHKDAYKALPCPPFDKSDHPDLCLQEKTKAGSTSDSVNKKTGQMKQMLSYRTVLLAQTGICSGILPMALRSTPHQSLPSSISASKTSSHSDRTYISQPKVMDYRQHPH